ncbi:exodeoxyribonuclease I [Marinospirillum sp. MEB164]|uniref:Exodeoxyribonuclease I n=1 Tax=Marinospirillum alkalitolerans TaxID=3123374 RepID=A0ABW8PUR3_9GAMM
MEFLWHDYETFGADPRRDRPCQFAAVRTDADLNEIGEPEMFFCQPADDYLPHPQAVLITGITPQQAKSEGYPEAEFAAKIHQLMSQPNTCVVGYNSLRFDDEITRHLFYRNFIDPYAREWQGGNSRWDLIDLVRTAYALRPEGLVWPTKEDGTPSFKLEDLTAANGITHGDAAHDALADVRATLALARKIKQAQPKLFEHLLGLRSKHQVAALVRAQPVKPLLHISSRFPAQRGCTGIVAPLGDHPTNPNAVICFDLSADPRLLLDLSAEQIRERLYTPQAELVARGQERVPLKLIHTNRCPVVLPVKALSEELAQRLGQDLAQQHQHWLALQPHLVAVQAKVQAVFSESSAFAAEQDPDLMLYGGGFFNSEDKALFAQLRAADPEELAEMQLPFHDPRLEEMFFRYRARNWPEWLSTHDMERWDEYRWARMQSTQSASLTLKQLEQEWIQLSQQPLNETQLFLLEELRLWVESILPVQALDAG